VKINDSSVTPIADILSDRLTTLRIHGYAWNLALVRMSIITSTQISLRVFRVLSNIKATRALCGLTVPRRSHSENGNINPNSGERESVLSVG
jgi:hypothetical protein